MKRLFLYGLWYSLFISQLLFTSIYAQGFEAKDGKIFIPEKDITTTVSYYTFDDVKIFTVRNSNNEIITHQDACQACGPVGFVQNGTAMKCNGCGLQYEIDDLGVDNPGSCWPFFVSNRTDGDFLILDQAELGVNLGNTFISKIKSKNTNQMHILNITDLNSNVSVAKSGEYTLSIYSISGKLILNMKKSLLSKGNHQFLFNKKLAKGEYLFRLETVNNSITQNVFIN